MRTRSSSAALSIRRSPSRRIDALLTIGATFLAVTLINQDTLVVEQYLAGNLAWRATNRLRADLTLRGS